MNKISWLLRRAKQIIRTQGLITLIRHELSFELRRFYFYDSYYLVETYIPDALKDEEAKRLPRIKDFTLKIICTNWEADELAINGFEFRSYVGNAKRKLDKGAIAFCIFTGHELACISWIAMTEEAKLGLRELPYRVNFSYGEACHAGLWTNPKYREMGLAPYVRFKGLQFMDERGKVVGRDYVRTGNVASSRAAARHGSKIYAEVSYLKVLWWKWWKEKPLT